MKLRLPEALKGFQFRPLTWFELNDFDADLVFPSLYGLIITGGERHHSNKLVRTGVDADGTPIRLPITPDDLIASLSRHPELEGFDNDRGRVLLREWVHSTVARIGRKTESRKGETVQYIQPIHLATYGAGLPTTAALRRDVDLALYAALEAHARSLGHQAPKQLLQTLFRDALGQGATYGTGQNQFRPAYDGTSQLDLTALVTMYYLEQFETPALLAGVPKQRAEAVRSTPFLIPEAMDDLGGQLLGYLAAYRGVLPASTISHALIALSSLGLLRYFLQTVATTSRLIDGERAEGAIAASGSLELYVDATGRRGEASDVLARNCVNRDLARVGRFFGLVQELRTLDILVSELAPMRDIPILDRLGRELDEFRSDPDVRADARAMIRQIRELNTQADPPVCSEDEFELLTDHVQDPLEKLSVLLGLRGANSGVTNYLKWYRTTGGLMKAYGLLDGNLTGRKNWRYYFKDELLSVLVQQAFVVTPANSADQLLTRENIRPKVSLREFLSFLSERYGIVIDRPPTGSDTPEAHRAAAENVEALKSRLRQMGYFQQLSDDFDAQYLHNPLFGAAR